ncbi:MAG: YggS family pyridoxal phosphate-dependent enzyme [Gammaproteobacteria bacterium]|nr:MAG: YggS family pyridoxal phosphate-dependent enzyme [Gammaproteobacteria bacterium]
MINIKDNIAAIEQQILQACQKNDRKFNEVCLLAVSKTKPNALIEQAYQAGQRHFGENYCQEALEKINQLKHLNDIYWHFIGPIQSNKTKLISENFTWVHSVERLKIIDRLNTQRGEYCAVYSDKPPLNICLQVNISQEPSKSGIMPEQVDEFAKRVTQSAHLTLRGLMAIPQKNAPTSTYLYMQDLYNQLKTQYSSVDTLSLGMSNDLDTAIAAGSTMVRIGTAIFGARDYQI